MRPRHTTPALLGTALLGTALLTTTAQALPPGDDILIRSTSGATCLTRPAQPAQVTNDACRADHARQIWRIGRLTNGQAWISTADRDWCLTHDDADVLVARCDEVDRTQVWWPDMQGDNVYVLRAAQGPDDRDWCVWAAGAYVGLQPCDPTIDGQRWSVPWPDEAAPA
ncbi:ricin-type beta-trefoil lectin domain protein [Actinokineospora enzanensis]|uniref:ricin-type beta-trefoil lectin domain protein n=1 Tax=Actinokineospora enzanensis TaxID=155975 RepID=UPI000368E083|nr:ricin-type beta-trefoil lectin domain protein [Actinokineospora enzanensis]